MGKQDQVCFAKITLHKGFKKYMAGIVKYFPEPCAGQRILIWKSVYLDNVVRIQTVASTQYYMYLEIYLLFLKVLKIYETAMRKIITVGTEITLQTKVDKQRFYNTILNQYVMLHCNVCFS